VADVVVEMLLDRRTATGDGSPQLEATAAAATSSMENKVRGSFMAACSYSGGGLGRRAFDRSLEQEVFRLGGFDRARCSVRSCERGPDTGVSPPGSFCPRGWVVTNYGGLTLAADGGS